MTMKIKLNQNLRAGTQDGERKRGKEKREETPTPTNLAQNVRSLKRAGEKKKRTDDGPNTDQKRGGGRAWHNLQGES